MAKMRCAIPLLSLALTGCGMPERQTRAGLIHAGVPRSIAACMAPRMVDRLSIGQLRRLGGLTGGGGAHDLPTLIARVQGLHDPEIIDVTANAAAVCALGLH